MGAPLSLLEMAARRLASGSSHTLELARDVLELRGNPGVASKAVFTLLGRDHRFQVDEEGYWSLIPGLTPPGVPLTRLSFAVVDVETTGSLGGQGDRATEVAIVRVDDGAIGTSFQTLLNPGRRIPPRIQGFTGITDRMVSVAPFFEGVADEVSECLKGRIFVAHNVGFDWGVIRGELLEAGGEIPELEQLCTVRLGRLLIPRLRSYGLDSLTAHFRIRVEGRHRALGDALVTAQLLLHLLKEAEARGISDLASLRMAFGGGRRRRRGRKRTRSREYDP